MQDLQAINCFNIKKDVVQAFGEVNVYVTDDILKAIESFGA